ncbi:hypothetical protein ACU4GD_25690 [Cupriavidus basilensis]
MAPAIYKSLPCEFARDPDPMNRPERRRTPNVLVVNLFDIPVKSVPDLIAMSLKSHPGKGRTSRLWPVSACPSSTQLRRADSAR